MTTDNAQHTDAVATETAHCEVEKASAANESVTALLLLLLVATENGTRKIERI